MKKIFLLLLSLILTNAFAMDEEIQDLIDSGDYCNVIVLDERGDVEEMFPAAADSCAGAIAQNACPQSVCNEITKNADGTRKITARYCKWSPTDGEIGANGQELGKCACEGKKVPAPKKKDV